MDYSTWIAALAAAAAVLVFMFGEGAGVKYFHKPNIHWYRTSKRRQNQSIEEVYLYNNGNKISNLIKVKIKNSNLNIEDVFLDDENSLEDGHTINGGKGELHAKIDLKGLYSGARVVVNVHNSIPEKPDIVVSHDGKIINPASRQSPRSFLENAFIILGIFFTIKECLDFFS